MQSFRRLAALLVLVLMATVQTGCASFKGNEVADATPIQQFTSQTQKPSVFVSVERYFADPSATGATPIAAAKTQATQSLQKFVSESGYFSAVHVEESQKASADYQIEFAIYNHGNMPLAFASGFLCGFTFGVIPGYGQDNFTMKAKLINNHGTKSDDFSNKDSMNTWIGLWFIPMMGNSPARISNEITQNQVQDILNKMFESGAFNAGSASTSADQATKGASL